MEKSDMLESLINYYTDGNKAKFSAMIGVKPQTVSAWISRNTFDAEVLFAKCMNISADWLLSKGNGEMLRNQHNADVCSPPTSINEELIRLRAENEVLREVVGLIKRNDMRGVG